MSLRRLFVSLSCLMLVYSSEASAQSTDNAKTGLESKGCLLPSPKKKQEIQKRREQFIHRCSAAHVKVYEADKKLSAWLSSITLAYMTAWKSHTAALEADSKDQKLVDMLIMDAALLVLTWAPGGSLAGTAMKRLIKPKTLLADVVIDTVKDGTKFTIRTGGHLLAEQIELKSLNDSGFSALPTDPFEWKEKFSERVSSEISLLAAVISNWSDLASDDKKYCSLDMSIDPVGRILPALKIDGNSMLELRGLNEEEKRKLSDTYEQGFCMAWIERYGYTTQLVHPIGMAPFFAQCRVVKNIGDNIMHRCKDELRVPVEELLKKSKDKAEKVISEIDSHLRKLGSPSFGWNDFIVERLCTGKGLTI